ncbi:MAG: hypothetical protein A2W93_14020 [Bacteroidetes bacterium GWF2_43_63]|nr:MAG: hypothetical protein A2W94_00590 [Bacteroidetes bacterium GWE2_42_42]OFY52462.1 MAG: hypothetical protein A2W93_14020 [Bacteroidetes bacterium GWF2_43_63]HBG71370.1 hypothetical protein [Bacteroidales bacterium]HCB60880.1 hypothetical protein [Bacteroidales bacterium]HCY23945.1 hypothetical protein [Bacteroidales bacterium]
MKKQFKSICLLIFFVFISVTPGLAQMVENKIDFNALNMDVINGQDGWTSVNNINADGNTSCVDINIGYGSLTPPDLSMCAYYSCGGPNVGRTASRVSAPSFPFDFANASIMEIQVDITAAWWGTFFGFGYDANSNGYVVPGIEQTAAYESNEGGIGFYLTKRPQSAALNCFMKPDGTKITFTYDSLYAGWNTYKMIIDFDANGGAGSLSLYGKSPGGAFDAISQIQNINLGLTPGTNTKTDPATWTKLFIQSTGSYAAFDNIIIRQPDVPPGMQYQYITFPSIGDHLTTDAPFQLLAYTNKGLPVTYSILSGPATVAGDMLSLTGTAGAVTVIASQAGDTVVMAAANDTVSFNVIDPLGVFPELSVKCPIAADTVIAPDLGKVLMFATATIDHSDILSIENVELIVDGGTVITANATENDYYFAYFDPLSQGTHSIQVIANSTGGTSTDTTFSFYVSQAAAPTRSEFIIDHLYMATQPNDGVVSSLDTTISMPVFSGTYSKIIAYLSYECPSEGCEEWDRVAKINTRGANGELIELVRYITPYGVACYDSLDITDLASQLQGKIELIANFPPKSVLTIEIKYFEGTPAHKYSWVTPLWHNDYPFGKYVAIGVAEQPAEVRDLNLSETYGIAVESAFIRIVSSGHGWGSNNSENAAEFRESTHHIKINGTNAFDQHLWRTCNPSPTSCQPQNGTWYYDRSGWCPGTIPQLWRFDLTANIGQIVNAAYIFDTTYVDYCSSFNPACNSSTCANCLETYNPYIIVAGDLITYYDDAPFFVAELQDPFGLTIFPNPSTGILTLASAAGSNDDAMVQIFSITGKLIMEFKWNGTAVPVDLSSVGKGVYFLKASSSKGIEYKQIVIQ